MVTMIRMLLFQLKIMSLIFKKTANKVQAEWRNSWKRWCLVKAITGSKSGQTTAGASAWTPVITARRLLWDKLRAVFAYYRTYNNNNESIFKAQNLVPRDYSKQARAYTHAHTHTHKHTHTHTRTHTHREREKKYIYIYKQWPAKCRSFFLSQQIEWTGNFTMSVGIQNYSVQSNLSTL